jgi:hypothetical protein
MIPAMVITNLLWSQFTTIPRKGEASTKTRSLKGENSTSYPHGPIKM